MKRILLLAAMAMAVAAHAQDAKMRAVGNVEMVVSYALDQLCDYPNQWRDSEWREEGTLMLEVGEGKAHSYVVEERNNVMRSLVEFGNKNHWRLDVNIHALVGETLIDHGQLTQIVNLDAAGVYQYTETAPKLKWKICDERKTVLDYDCRRAICSFRGRDYEAWFAEEIPVGFGPWKFGGLPGLILEIADMKNEYHFTATGIEKVRDAKQMQMACDDAIRHIKRERALKMEMLMHKDHGTYAADYGIKFSLEGAEHSPWPYYPLELKYKGWRLAQSLEAK